MAFLQDGRAISGDAAIETKTKAMRVTMAPRGAGYSISGTSGLIAAAAAVNGLFWAMRINPAAGAAQNSLGCFIEKMRVSFTTITAFTSVTAGRRLSLYRGSGAPATGGSVLTPVAKDSTSAVSQISQSNNGDARIAATGSLGIASIVWETSPIWEMPLTGFGAASANNEDVYDFTNCPILLQNGQILGIRNPQAMDASGTWQLTVSADYSETVGWNATIPD